MVSKVRVLGVFLVVFLVVFVWWVGFFWLVCF